MYLSHPSASHRGLEGVTGEAGGSEEGDDTGEYVVCCDEEEALAGLCEIGGGSVAIGASVAAEAGAVLDCFSLRLEDFVPFCDQL